MYICIVCYYLNYLHSVLLENCLIYKIFNFIVKYLGTLGSINVKSITKVRQQFQNKLNRNKITNFYKVWIVSVSVKRYWVKTKQFFLTSKMLIKNIMGYGNCS